MTGARGRWWVSFALFAAGGVAWAVATPVFAAPDEPAHVIRAAAAGRGELLGHQPPPAQRVPPFGGSLEVTAPGIYRNSARVTCFVFHPNRPAGCFHLRGPDRDVEMVTYVGHHPPAYYATIGLLSRWVTPGRTQVLLMRALGALAIAALLASSLATLGRVVAPMWAGAGLAIALSPMVLFLAGVVSPSGIETGAAIGVWVHGAALATNRDGVVDARVIDRLGIAASVLVLSRALSPLWLAVIALVLLLVTTRSRLVDLVQTRRAQVWGGVLVACLAVQAWWYFSADPLGHLVGTPVHEPAEALVRTSIGKIPQLLHEMVGVFGWLDTRSPSLTYYVWMLALGALVGLMLTFATARFVRAIVAATVAALVLPVIIEALGAGEAGFIWQGRYSLPLAVGVPLLAGIALGSNEALEHVRRRLPVVLVAGLVVAQVAAFAQALRRYAVGQHGSLWFFSDSRWDPPIPALLLIVLYAAVMAVMFWWIVLAPRAGQPRRVEAPVVA